MNVFYGDSDSGENKKGLPLEEIRAFLDKWRDRRDFDDLSEEETEQLEAESPFSLSFKAEAMVDGCGMRTENSSSFGWNPFDEEREAALAAGEKGDERQEKSWIITDLTGSPAGILRGSISGGIRSILPMGRNFS